MIETPWQNPIFRETTYLVLGILFCVAVALFPFRNRHSALVAAWASLQSWLFAAPIIFFALALGQPWPLIALTFAAILGAKEFFQITGMYHRSSFVWLTYVGITGSALCIYYGYDHIYDLMPMFVLAAFGLVPLYKNEYKNMVQYMALSLFNFIFMGWAFLHMGKIVQWEHGALMAIYIILLTEVCDNIALAASRLFGRKKLADNITSRRTIEGFFISFILTILLAYGMRHLLPDRSESFWLASGLVAFLVGSLGDLLLAVIRRDLGVKDRGAFILGRG
ncbi:MAG TPA: phosphatidate cytidylyltransferase, partial [Bdellovibrionales bacterium]|nr:phosphatidate cytidylyltransferase [Bdellovibrionales bacterium]